MNMDNCGLGTWFLDSTVWPPVETGRAKAVLHRAFDRGVRHFDTAESYGNGRAEQVLGQALRTHLRGQREHIHVATKSVVRPPNSLRSHLERSLRRMGLEYVDTYYIHWPRHGIDLAAAVEELSRQRERGLLRRIGLCNVTRREVETAHRATRIDTVQFGYNLIWRRPESQRLTALTQRRIAYSVLAQGLLARPFPYEPQWDTADHRRATPLFQEPPWSAVNTFQQEFVSVCREAGFVPAAAAVLWALNRVDGALAGARSIEQLDRLIDGIAAARTRPDDLEHLLLSVTDSSSELQRALPQLPNMFGYVPTPCRSC